MRSRIQDHRLQVCRAQDLAVLGLADGGEAEAEEELLGAALAALPDGGEALEAARAGLVGEGLHGEAADAATLRARLHVDRPEAAAELLARLVRVEVALDE